MLLQRKVYLGHLLYSAEICSLYTHFSESTFFFSHESFFFLVSLLFSNFNIYFTSSWRKELYNVKTNIFLEIIIILYAKHMRVLSWPKFKMQLIITTDAKENKPLILSKLDCAIIAWEMLQRWRILRSKFNFLARILKGDQYCHWMVLLFICLFLSNLFRFYLQDKWLHLFWRPQNWPFRCINFHTYVS